MIIRAFHSTHDFFGKKKMYAESVFEPTSEANVKWALKRCFSALSDWSKLEAFRIEFGEAFLLVEMSSGDFRDGVVTVTERKSRNSIDEPRKMTAAAVRKRVLAEFRAEVEKAAAEEAESA